MKKFVTWFCGTNASTGALPQLHHTILYLVCIPSSFTYVLCIECHCFSLQMCFISDVCSVPNSWRTRNQRHGFIMVGLHNKNFASKPTIKMHYVNLVCWFSGKFLKSLPPPTRCQILLILKLKCTKFDFDWDSAPDPTGGDYNAPQGQTP